MTDTATITVNRYRTPGGQPTCCANHPAGQTCRFLGVRAFGAVDVCMLGEQRDIGPRTLGFTRPLPDCEVWAAPQFPRAGAVAAHRADGERDAGRSSQGAIAPAYP